MAFDIGITDGQVSTFCFSSSQGCGHSGSEGEAEGKRPGEYKKELISASLESNFDSECQRYSIANVAIRFKES